MNIKVINRDYTILLTGQLISILGNIINGIATMWIVYEALETGSKTGLLFGLSAIPALILTPFVGNIIDMFNRKYLLFWCDLLAGLASITLAVLTQRGLLGFWNLLIIFSLDAILFAVVASTRSSLIQNLVKQNEYLKANSINLLVQNIANVSLPMIGAILIARFSPSACFIIDAVSFFVAAFFTLTIKSYKFEQSTEDSFFTKFKDGLNYIKNNRQYVDFIFFLSIINFIGASDTMLVRILIEKSKFHVDYFGFFKSAVAIGSILIAFLLSKLKNTSSNHQNHRKTMSGALALMAFGFLVYGLGNKFLLLGGALVFGFGSTLFNLAFFAYMQTYIDKNYYGRVICLVFFVSQIAQPLSYWAFGHLVDWLSVYSIFFLDGFVLLIVTAFFYRSSLKQVIPLEVS